LAALGGLVVWWYNGKSKEEGVIEESNANFDQTNENDDE
jgi:hypothetical protein